MLNEEESLPFCPYCGANCLLQRYLILHPLCTRDIIFTQIPVLYIELGHKSLVFICIYPKVLVILVERDKGCSWKKTHILYLIRVE